MSKKNQNAPVAQAQQIETPEVAFPAQKTQYAGNIMYVNRNITNPEEEYITVMLRFADGQAVEAIPVGLFMKKGLLDSIEGKVGDLIVFYAKNIVESKMQLPDGSIVHRAYGLDRDRLEMGRAKPVEVKLKPSGTPVGGGIFARLAQLAENAFGGK